MKIFVLASSSRAVKECVSPVVPFASSYLVGEFCAAPLARSSAARSSPSRPHGSAEWANISET